MDWKNVADELCRCGHRQSDHGSNVHENGKVKVPGHGKCSKCDCPQYTWKAFLDKNGRVMK